MNGFTMLAESYKKVLDRNEPGDDRKYLESQVKVLSFLGTCSKEEIELLFDSSAFNSIARGYVERACDELEFDEETKSNVSYKVKALFDRMNAHEAEKYFYKEG